jgi:hypothetical protein
MEKKDNCIYHLKCVKIIREKLARCLAFPLKFALISHLYYNVMLEVKAEQSVAGTYE